MKVRKVWHTLVCCGSLLVGFAQAGPSTNLDDYALFAADRLTAKGLEIASGHVGVNAGPLAVRDFFTAPASDVVADQVNVPAPAQCAQQFANASVRPSPACLVTSGVSVPLVPDVAAACGFPSPFPACDPAMLVSVALGTSTTLAAGTYGDVVVARGATLQLSGGTYQLCSLKVSRGGRLEITGATELDVAGSLAFGPGTFVGPAAGSGLTFDDLHLFVDGTAAQYSRVSHVEARLCAPAAAMRLTQGGQHVGSIVARSIRTERIVLELPQVNRLPCGQTNIPVCGGTCPEFFFCGSDGRSCRCFPEDG